MCVSLRRRKELSSAFGVRCPAQREAEQPTHIVSPGGFPVAERRPSSRGTIATARKIMGNFWPAKSDLPRSEWRALRRRAHPGQIVTGATRHANGRFRRRLPDARAAPATIDVEGSARARQARLMRGPNTKQLTSPVYVRACRIASRRCCPRRRPCRFRSSP